MEWRVQRSKFVEFLNFERHYCVPWLSQLYPRDMSKLKMIFFFNQEQLAFHFYLLEFWDMGGTIFIPSSKSSYPVGNHILFILPSNYFSNLYSYFYAHYNFLSVSLFFKNVIYYTDPLTGLPSSSLFSFPDIFYTVQLQ